MPVVQAQAAERERSVLPNRKAERKAARRAATRLRSLELRRALLEKAGYGAEHVDTLVETTGPSSRKFGVVTSKLYEEIISRRTFDQYGRHVLHIASEKEKLAKSLERKLGDEDSKNDGRGGVDRQRRSYPKIEKGQVPLKPKRFGPPGLRPPINDETHSEGNDAYFNYAGEWLNGSLHGFGKFHFVDDSIYEGGWESNRRTGDGVATYSNGSSYSGQWKKGYYHGRGIHKMSDGSVYEGDFREGVRQGSGRLTLPCGLVYVGNFFVGQPHGRGEMISPSLGLKYRGFWENGFIRGTGTLSTRDFKDDSRYWPLIGGGLSLRTAYETKKHEERMDHLFKVNQQAKFKGKLNALQLREYVDEVRNEIHLVRKAQRRQQHQEHKRLMKERRERQMQARLSAIRNTHEDREGSDSESDSESEFESDDEDDKSDT